MNTPEIQVRITCASVHSIGPPLSHPPLTFMCGWEHLSSFVSLCLLSLLGLSSLFSFNPMLHLLSTIQNIVLEQPLAFSFAWVHLIEKLRVLMVCLVEDSKPFRVYHMGETDRFPIKADHFSQHNFDRLLCYNILFLLSQRCCIPTGKWVIGEKRDKEKMYCWSTQRWWRWWWWWW